MAIPLRVTVAPDRLDALPGEALTVDVTIRNTSDVVEHYVVDVLGLPEGSTARTEPEVTKLRPGETGNATVTLAVRKTPPAPAGSQVLGVLVHSRYREDASRCEELPLTVAPVDAVAVRVAPEVATGKRSARYSVDVSNEGNTPLRLRLTATDPERRVVPDFQPSIVEIAPGAAVRTMLSVRAPVPWGREKQRALRIEAGGVGVSGRANATFVQRPRLASRLARVGGMLAGVLVLAAAVVTAALIVDNKEPQANPTPVATGLPSDPAVAPSVPPPAAPSESAAPPTAAPTTAGPASASPSASSGGDAALPREIDLTRPFAASGGGIVPSDAFRAEGITLSGLPDRDGPEECAGATALAARQDGAGGFFLTGALPDDPTACNYVPIQIRFTDKASAVEMVLAKEGKRQMEVCYRDLSCAVENDLRAQDDGRRGGIDYVVIRGLPDLSAEPPPAGAKLVRYTPQS